MVELSPWRLLVPPLLAALAALAVDQMSRRRGLDPPGFRTVPGREGDLVPALLRTLVLLLLAVVLWIGVFSPLAMWGATPEPDLSQVAVPQLFLLHLILVGFLACWYVLGFGRLPRRGPAASWWAQLGFAAPRVGAELGLGLAAGMAAWLTVLGVMLTLGLILWQLGGDKLVPQSPPALIPWIAGLPVVLRLGLSLSAGVVEETFFRGFLQPRTGIAFSTALFVLAHASYEQPLMLVGITLLSLMYALLVWWRQTIWPAIAAHVLFDAVQLLVVIPAALELMPADGEGGLMPVAVLAG